MATVRPFRALRPDVTRAGRLCELPYDVLSSEEARVLAQSNPLSFFRVSKPEVGLPGDTDPYSDEVYALARAELDRFVAEGLLKQDAEPGYHLYRQQMGAHVQTGLVAVASCREYLDGVVRRHELTRPEKENDRVRHMEALDAQTGPAFLAFRAPKHYREWLAEKVRQPAAIDFVAGDDVRHTTWIVTDPGECEQVEGWFGNIERLYIADGHHRSAAAARVYEARSGAGGSDGFLSVLFPHDELQILPYNRLVKDLNGLSEDGVMERLRDVFEVRLADSAPGLSRYEMGMILGGRWYHLTVRVERRVGAAPADMLDVSLLQRHVLEPVFDIVDPRKSQRVEFVGGIRGAGELEREVRSGRAACGFLMHPTGMEDLMEIADAGGLMPPKSTWFEPKLRDGLFCHLLREE